MHLTVFAVFMLFCHPTAMHPFQVVPTVLLLKPKLGCVMPVPDPSRSVVSHCFQNKTQTLTTASLEARVTGPQSDPAYPSSVTLSRLTVLGQRFSPLPEPCHHLWRFLTMQMPAAYPTPTSSAQ